ncbi:glycosyltransferase family 2 protein [Lishizhenia sp.]|uniref:glycosyltransferase family 2 protein n=1 Tax=Lishizhenia sp. TaxID=2497594 RepID=UPI00299F2835|nr:glycosyltransferase [Lishizhenia sp.]MDX1446465.1 glycosyltransferase [Lishizhenia sp.]
MEDPSLDISVVIVNYNVEYFLEQCLNSAFKSLEKVSGEIFVVDNNSIDGSVEMVRKKFPAAKVIANKDNVGFSKANNQAMRIAKGKYVLLLNPDTVVEEDTFEKCVNFMDAHPDAGGLGVRMIDGKGKFLPESKRGLPTPAVAFYKIFGISKLFPKSKKFGQYHLGYLDEFETNEVEILSGAFMLMSNEALQKVGLLDETFFMYGEDIDLSYRIIQGGFKNYYFPETQIIHYKGESTKKSSINYVFVFYRAMVIFAEKHFSQKNAKVFSFLINLAIYFRAGLALTSRFIKHAFLPVTDLTFIITGLVLLTNYWSKANIEFPSGVLKYALPAYGITWLLSNFFQGGYDKPIKLKKFFSGSLIGTAVILMVYALLPKDYQFSRLYILIGTLWVMFYYLLSRVFLHFAVGKSFDLFGNKNKKFAIVGSPKESERVANILAQTNQKIDKVLFVGTQEHKEAGQVGVVSQLDQIVHIEKVDEIIFCAKDNTAESIIGWMSAIDGTDLDFKIAQPDSMYLIGSNSVDTSGDLYVMDINAIVSNKNKRNKRIFDFTGGCILLVLSPLLIWFYSKKSNFISNVFSLIVGVKSFVGYSSSAKETNSSLPKIKHGILSPEDAQNVNSKTGSVNIPVFKLNLIYARDYTLTKDIKILLNSWRQLDR